MFIKELIPVNKEIRKINNWHDFFRRMKSIIQLFQIVQCNHLYKVKIPNSCLKKLDQLLS